MRLPLVLILFALPFSATAYTESPTGTFQTDGSQSDVIAAIAAASAGDTITLPAGNFTWNTATNNGTYSVYVGKQLTIQGAGPSSTVITDECNALSNRGVFALYADGIDFSGIHITQDLTNGSDAVILTADARGVKIHNCKFSGARTSGDYFRLASVQGGDIGTGVVYDCEFINTATSGAFQLIEVSGNAKENPPTEANPVTGSFIIAPGWGDTNAWYIEDCYFEMAAPQDASIEGYSGGRAVIRYNTFLNGHFGMHGNDSSTRSTHRWEFYGNTGTNTISGINNILYCRGGTLLSFSNHLYTSGSADITQARIQIQQYRSSYNPGTLANGYLNGTEPSDGNWPAFDPDNWAAQLPEHDGSDNASTLTDSSQSWTTDEWVGYYVINITDNWSYGVATANTATTITVTLSGGDEADFDAGDYVVISEFMGVHDAGNNSSSFSDASASWTTDSWLGTGTASLSDTNSAYYVKNLTDGSGGFATANTGTTVTVTLSGGTDNDFDDGDLVIGTWGYPGLDQVGWGGPTTFNTTWDYSTQRRWPTYEWANNHNGSSLTWTNVLAYTDYAPAVQPDSDMFLKDGREFFNGTAAPGYTPLEYPHPLRGVVVGGSANNATVSGAIRF